jgi:hypothetical protein
MDEALRRLILIGLICLSASSAHAANIFVSQSGGSVSGFCTGQSTISVATFNGTSLSPGDFVALCNTITTPLTPVGNGSMGNVITISLLLAKISATACGANGCINLNGHSFYLIDGGGACGIIGIPGPWNPTAIGCSGIIEATGNGTGSGSGESIGISAVGGAHDIEIRNLNIRNMYVHNGTGSDNPPNLYYCVNLVGVNVLVHNNVMHDCGAGVVGNVTSTTISVYNNEIYNCNWSAFFSGSATINGIQHIKVYLNSFHDWQNWDETGHHFHHDGCFFAGNDTLADGVNDVNCYQNYFWGTWSDPTVCATNSNTCGTAPIYMNDGNHMNAWLNIIQPTVAGQITNNGWIYTQSFGTNPSNDFIGSNTVLGNGTTAGSCAFIGGDSSMTFQDNVLQNCKFLITVTTATHTTTFTALSNNTYQNGTLSGSWQQDSTTYTSMANWQTAVTACCGQGDGSSQATTSSLGLNTNAQPTPGSILRTAGANLTSLGFFVTDILGNPRPASGAWDAGALNGTAGTLAGFIP